MRSSRGNPPLVVVLQSRLTFDQAVLSATNSGWPVSEGFAPARSDEAALRVGLVACRAEASAALEAACAGQGVIALVPGDPLLAADLVEDLEAIGSVSYFPSLGAVDQLTAQQRALLADLADGLTLERAAERQHLARRTAARRLAEARQVLGVDTTLEAVQRMSGATQPFV